MEIEDLDINYLDTMIKTGKDMYEFIELNKEILFDKHLGDVATLMNQHNIIMYKVIYEGMEKPN